MADAQRCDCKDKGPPTGAGHGGSSFLFFGCPVFKDRKVSPKAVRAENRVADNQEKAEMASTGAGA